MSLYLMSVYSIARSQLCWDWVLDYVSMRLLSLTQFIWRPSVLQLCCSGTHRINTRRNVTVPDVSVFHHKKSIVLRLGAWLCKHETALPHTIHLETIRPPVVLLLALTESIHVVMSLYLMSVYSIARSQLCFNWVLDYVSMRLLSPHNSFGDHPSPSSPALALTESIHLGMSLYLMWVYSIARSQLCFNWVLDYVSMRLLSLTQFIWRPSVLQLCCSGTHRINTRSNVTVPDVSVFHRKKSIVFQLGAWLCKHETALPHTIHLETSVPSSPALALTESIQVVMSLYLMSVYSIARSQLLFQLGAWLCKHETALPHTIHLETIRPPVVLLWHSQNHTRSNVTVPDVSVFHRKKSIVFHWVLDYVSMRLLSSYNSFGDHRLQLCCSGTHRINTSSMSLYLMSVYSIARSQLCFNWCLIM